MSEAYLEHYGRSKQDGAPVGSGRYPWGSGEDPYQRNKSFLNHVYELRRQGMSNTDIARGMGMTTTVFRQRIAIANNEIRKANVATALKYKEAGYSNQAIAEKMGLPNESSVRSLLNPAIMERSQIAKATADVLKNSLDEKGGYLDIGFGTEYQIKIRFTLLLVLTAKMEVVLIKVCFLHNRYRANALIFAMQSKVVRTKTA